MDGPVGFAGIDVSDLDPSPDDENMRVVEGDPDVRMRILYEGQDLRAGIAAVRPCKFEYRTAHADAIQLLEGAAKVTVDGRTVEMKAGEAIFLEKGVETAWEVTEAIREYFVGYIGED